MNKYKITVRLSENEKEHLLKASDDYGIDISKYIRYLLLKDMGKNVNINIKEIQKKVIAIKNLTNEINYIGHNINQITKNNNSYLYSPEEKNLLDQQMNKIIELLLNIKEN